MQRLHAAAGMLAGRVAVDAPGFSPRASTAYRTTDTSSAFRYWWTKAIAMLPSPTAAATRFTGL